MRDTRILFFCLLSIISLQLKAQTAADSLLNDLDAETEQVKLLPEKMLLSQRIFWGEKGLYRLVGIAPQLTPENRQRELKIRRNMFKIHQAVGITTAAAMIAQGLLGAKLYKVPENYTKIKNAHETLATGINIAYATTALMAFTAPPKQISRKGFNSSNVHRALSYVHLSGMITTNILANRMENFDGDGDYAKIKKFHRAAAYTTFASYFAAIAVMKFEF